LNIIPRHDWYRYSYTRRRFRQGELHYQLAVPTLFRVSRQVFIDSALTFLRMATIVLPQHHQAGVWAKLYKFVSRFPPYGGFGAVRTIRFDMDATMSGFLAAQRAPGNTFHHSHFPSLRRITLDMDLDLAHSRAKTKKPPLRVMTPRTTLSS
jgi:hypothetical protein